MVEQPAAAVMAMSASQKENLKIEHCLELVEKMEMSLEEVAHSVVDLKMAELVVGLKMVEPVAPWKMIHQWVDYLS